MKFKTLAAVFAISFLLVGCGDASSSWPKNIEEDIQFSIGDYEIPFFEATSYDSEILNNGMVAIYCYPVAEDADEIYNITAKNAGFETTFQTEYNVYYGTKYVTEKEYINLEYGVDQDDEKGLFLVIYAWLAEDYMYESWPTNLIEKYLTYDVPALTGSGYVYFCDVLKENNRYYLEIIVVGSNISSRYETAYANLFSSSGWQMEPRSNGGYQGNYEDTTFVEFWLFDYGMMVIDLWDVNWN